MHRSTTMVLLALLACGCAGRIERSLARSCTPLVVDAERAPSCPPPPRSGEYMIVAPASEADELDIEAERVFYSLDWVVYADPWTCDVDGRIATQDGEVADPVLDDPSDLDVDLSGGVRFRIRVDGRDYVMQYEDPVAVHMPGEGTGCLTVFPGEGGRALHRISVSFGWRHWLDDIRPRKLSNGDVLPVVKTRSQRFGAPRLIFAVVDDAPVLIRNESRPGYLARYDMGGTRASTCDADQTDARLRYGTRTERLAALQDIDESIGSGGDESFDSDPAIRDAVEQLVGSCDAWIHDKAQLVLEHWDDD